MFTSNSNAFATPVSEKDHSQLIQSVARKIVARRMAAPAVMFIESFKPVNRIFSQIIMVVSPFASLFFSYKELDDFCDLLQDRRNVEKLTAEIDALEEKYQQTKQLNSDIRTH